MSEDLYAKPDLTRKVRFQKSEKDRNEDVADNDARIYDNYCPKEGPSTKPQEDTTEQQQTSSIRVGSGDRNLLRAAVAFVVLLCLILLASLTVLVALWIQDRKDWSTENYGLKMDAEKLRREKEELETNFSKIKSINDNLTEVNNMLKEEKERLMTINKNLTDENERLHNESEATCCPSSWIKFENSCYFISTTKKTWTESRNMCEYHGADLVIISNFMEQAFITSLKERVWIGLTDEETENSWKWVNGEAATTTYWNDREPNNAGAGENCVVITKTTQDKFPLINNWNDESCGDSVKFICEKALQ